MRRSKSRSLSGRTPIACLARTGSRPDIDAVDDHPARVGAQQPGDHRQRGGLACAVRADDPVEGALCDVEGHAVDRHGVAESFVQSGHGEHGGRGRCDGRRRGRRAREESRGREPSRRARPAGWPAWSSCASRGRPSPPPVLWPAPPSSVPPSRARAFGARGAVCVFFGLAAGSGTIGTGVGSAAAVSGIVSVVSTMAASTDGRALAFVRAAALRCARGADTLVLAPAAAAAVFPAAARFGFGRTDAAWSVASVSPTRSPLCCSCSPSPWSPEPRSSTRLRPPGASRCRVVLAQNSPR